MSIPTDDAQNPIVSMREYIERVLDERDRLYGAKFVASEVAVSAALIAQKTSVDAALVAADRAVAKADIANEKRFDAVNEFRGQLNDQAKTFMPRTETTALIKSIDDKVDSLQTNFDGKLEALRASFEKSIDSISKEISGLRESRSESNGHLSGGKDLWGYMVAIAAIALTIIFHFVK